MFHLVQKEYNIRIPTTEETRCHAFVKEQIEGEIINSDYADLEVFRVDADYHLNEAITKRSYLDALEIKEKLLVIITGEGDIPYDEDDESFYNKFRRN